MKVFLLEDVVKVGKKHTFVNVTTGYYHNYLAPNNLALVDNPTNANKINKMLNYDANASAEVELSATLMKGEIEKLKLEFHLTVHENKTFGHITHHDLLVKLREKDIHLKKYVFHDSGNYGVGEHEVVLELTKNVHAKLHFVVHAVVA